MQGASEREGEGNAADKYPVRLVRRSNSEVF